MTASSRIGGQIRRLEEADLDRVVEIDALHTGTEKREYWTRVFREFLTETGNEGIGLGAFTEGALRGYLFGEVRAFEFGSEPCGWIFAVAVDPSSARERIASSLLAEACERFRTQGVTKVRTMVVRNDVSVMSFFRSRGFVGGPFVQLEYDLSNGE